jgi:hypothetical protein
MRISRKSSVALAVVLAVGLCPAGAQNPRQARQQARAAKAAKAAAEKGVKSLIRRDLLNLKKPEAAPPKRNIFAPRIGPPTLPAGAARPAQPLMAPEFSAGNDAAETKEAPPPPPVIRVNLRYIGFIVSDRRLVALVIFEGQAVAVVEGDVVGEGIRIGKISREQVEVNLPDSSTRTFSLEEGE